ncbi:hypothetical protein [Patiriisocius hiemis]|uniref:Uncharacterized protein n=1 Tax=Patiriisocius hiemis TaxID=3075604 RepID=A0ABU2Y9C9_9FLAO|nr:hypothetical protein [Constantimarinum sp. W242]MDT0554783.1 hypothetical protein [Constantimarinum sp. W242]
MATAIKKAIPLRKVVSNNTLIDSANSPSIKEITSKPTKLDVVYRRSSKNTHLEDWQDFFNQICEGIIDEIS